MKKRFEVEKYVVNKKLTKSVRGNFGSYPLAHINDGFVTISCTMSFDDAKQFLKIILVEIGDK